MLVVHHTSLGEMASKLTSGRWRCRRRGEGSGQGAHQPGHAVLGGRRPPQRQGEARGGRRPPARVEARRPLPGILPVADHEGALSLLLKAAGDGARCRPA